MSGVERRQLLGGMVAGSMLGSTTSSAPAVQGTTDARARWLNLLATSATSVLDFIPRALHADIAARTCRVDLASYVNAAIRRVVAQPGGGVLFFPRGAYEVSEIDATNADASEFATALHLLGEGRFATVIRPAVPGAVLMNAAGRNNMTVQSIQFDSTRFASQAAIWLCRTAASPNCNNNRFFDVLVSGNYVRAGVVAIAAESTSWLTCRFENANAEARHRCFVTSHQPASMPLRSRLGTVAVASSNTDNTMVDCEFYAPYAGAAPMHYVGSASYAMQGCTVITGDASGSRLVSYRPVDTVFNGPITWVASHFEVFGRDNVVHFLDAPRGVSYFRSVNCLSGNFVVGSGTDLLSFDRNIAGAQPVLMASTWTVPAAPWNARTLGFRVFGLSDSSIDFKIGDGVGEVEVTGYAGDSRITAARRSVARMVSETAQ